MIKNDIKVRFDVVNVFDEVYELRSGTGVGVFAPQFGPRRGYYGGCTNGFLTMFPYRINENQIIWLALIVSLLIHGLIFIFPGTTFIQHAQYSVQPSAQMVEVSIEEIKSSQRRVFRSVGYSQISE